MKCTDCRFEDSCELRDIEPSLLGCEGRGRPVTRALSGIVCYSCSSKMELIKVDEHDKDEFTTGYHKCPVCSSIARANYRKGRYTVDIVNLIWKINDQGGKI